MKFNEEQTLAVKSLIKNGEKISNVQKMLSEKFGINITYMDLRLLIDDLDIEIKKEAEKAAEPEAEMQEQAPHGVSVELDKVQRPGLMASGSVVFSDGVKAAWELDQYGRFGMNAEAGAEYRPSEEDMVEFQNNLRAMLGAG